MFVPILYSGLWTVPDVTGEPPPPCSNFSMVSLGDNRGAMFGGFQPEAARMSDVFIAELTNTTVVRNVIINGCGLEWPQATLYMISCYL